MALGTGALMPTNGQAPFHVLLIRATFYILLYSIRSWPLVLGPRVMESCHTPRQCVMHSDSFCLELDPPHHNIQVEH